MYNFLQLLFDVLTEWYCLWCVEILIISEFIIVKKGYSATQWGTPPVTCTTPSMANLYHLIRHPSEIHKRGASFLLLNGCAQLTNDTYIGVQADVSRTCEGKKQTHLKVLYRGSSLSMLKYCSCHGLVVVWMLRGIKITIWIKTNTDSKKLVCKLGSLNSICDKQKITSSSLLVTIFTLNHPCQKNVPHYSKQYILEREIAFC